MFALCLSLLFFTAHASAPSACLHLFISPETETYAHHVLKFALAELQVAHTAIRIHGPSLANDKLPAIVRDGFSAPMVRIDMAASADARPPVHSERYTVSSTQQDDLSVHILAGGKLAVAYALHDLREHLTLALARSGAGQGAQCTAYAAAVRTFSAPPAPVYEVRTWSEEGQLLDLPDRAYYCSSSSDSETSPTSIHLGMDCQGGINVTLITAEMQALEYEIVPALLRLRMNSLTILHSDLEDYVTYSTLPQYLPGATPTTIYPAGDPHYARAAALGAIVGPWVEHLTNDYGLAVYFQPYELSAAPGMCQGGNYPSGTYNCSLGSPALLPILQTRYTEFFRAVPSAAGIVATVADSWAPRAGYDFITLWSTTEELAQVATLFYDAIVNTTGKKMVFRLWTLGKAVDWPTLRDGSPPGVEFSAKITAGDFLLDFPINPLLNSTAPSERRFMVLTDAFRQYNGWTSGVCYMGPQWAPRLAIAAANGAKDMNGWGSWAPGCTWPDSGPQLLNWTQADGYKSWHGYWNSYRMFNGTATNGGFSMTQANAYALYRLSWNASDSSEQIALDWATLYFGAKNAAPVAGLLAQSINAWYQTSNPSAIGDFTLFWTMMVKPSTLEFPALLLKGVTADQCRLAMNLSMEALAAMQGYLDQVDPSAIPGSTSQSAAAYSGLTRSVAISGDYLTAMFTWREAGIRNASLAVDASPADCAAQAQVLANLSSAVSTFGARYPLEDANWAVSTLGQELYSAPDFFAVKAGPWYRTMAEWIPAWQAALAKACP